MSNIIHELDHQPRQALITAKIESDEYGSILKSVTDILFFATPHRGAENVKLLARMASIVNTPTRGLGLSPTVRSDLLKGLEKESKELYDISTSFRKLLPDLRIVSFVEKRTMLNLNKLVSVQCRYPVWTSQLISCS